MDIKTNTEAEEKFVIREGRREDKIKKQKRFYQVSTDLYQRVFIDQVNNRLGNA